MYKESLEHPAITQARETGYPRMYEPEALRCPECGEACDTIYVNRRGGVILGCEVCISSKSADMVPECYPIEAARL